MRSVDEITDDDLENVAYRSKDKIWDKENVSGPIVPPFLTFTLLLLTTFTLPYPPPPPSGQLVPPVPAEDAGHKDHLSQRFLRRSQRSILWAMPEKPLRGRRA